MSSLKSRWKRKGTGEIIHPETEIDQLKNGDNALAGLISLLLKSATTADARSAISAAAASHTHSSGDIQSFASDVITAIGEETLEALGVRYSITTNGYICFGQLFGGLILQWYAADMNTSQWTSYSGADSVYDLIPLLPINSAWSTLNWVSHKTGDPDANKWHFTVNVNDKSTTNPSGRIRVIRYKHDSSTTHYWGRVEVYLLHPSA